MLKITIAFRSRINVSGHKERVSVLKVWKITELFNYSRQAPIPHQFTIKKTIDNYLYSIVDQKTRKKVEQKLWQEVTKI